MSDPVNSKAEFESVAMALVNEEVAPYGKPFLTPYGLLVVEWSHLRGRWEARWFDSNLVLSDDEVTRYRLRIALTGSCKEAS